MGSSAPSDSTTRWKALWPYAPLAHQPIIGANIGWETHAYGSDLTRDFDPDWWQRRFEFLEKTPYRVVRIWLFESGEGIKDHGITTEIQETIRVLLELARKHNLYIYFTALNGNTTRGRAFYREQFNILHDRYGAQEKYLTHVLKPLASQIAEHPNTFALDLINEAEALRFKGTASSIRQIRAFIRRSTKAVRSVAPDLKVTASAGWHVGSINQSLGLYRGLGLDFYDLHVYNLFGNIWLCESARQRAQEEQIPIILGEFGALASRLGKRHEARTYESLAQNAIDCGFSGVLPWKLEDPYNPHHSLTRRDSLEWNRIGLTLLHLFK